MNAKINRGCTVPVLSEKLRCMERHRETQVNMTTFAKISAIKKNGRKRGYDDGDLRCLKKKQ